MSYPTFKNQWLGKRVDYDKVYGYQCVDLIKQYLAQEFGLSPKAWGNAIDYWYNTNPAILEKFDKLSTNVTRQGDIVIFSGVNGNPYGHIGVVDATGGATLEQNGSTGNGSGIGRDAIRVRVIPLSRIVGVLRRKEAKPSAKMPDVGSTIKVTVPRTVFKPGTTEKVGTLQPDTRIVRGYDPVYGGRIIVNSKALGNGLALALYYTNGTKIDGWS
jgi:N-acetylmuramoyl-L-alanine amidase